MSVSGLGLRVSCFGFRVTGFGFRVSSFGFRVPGSGLRVPGVAQSRVNEGGFREVLSRVWGGFRVQVVGET